MSDHGSYGFSRFCHLPGFDADKHGIDVSNLRRIIRGEGRLNYCLSRGSFDAKTMRTNCTEMFPARDENDIVTGERQLCAEIATCATGSKYHNTHGMPL